MFYLFAFGNLMIKWLVWRSAKKYYQTLPEDGLRPIAIVEYPIFHTPLFHHENLQLSYLINKYYGKGRMVIITVNSG